jgi:hypothetical protein
VTFLAAWLVFPLLLALLALGCGLLVEEIGRFRLPGALLMPVGLALIIIASQLTTSTDATAELTVPLVTALAAAGLGLSPPWRRGRVEPWVAAAAVTVFALYAAPVVFSGEPTFTGYIKLDDTATWLALTDRVMEHGRDLNGLAPSSYEATLDIYNAGGYPVGAFLPFGIGHTILGTDTAWLYQPCMSFYAAMLALALSELARPLVAVAKARAGIAAIAAQPAILFGYVMWGGIKEIAAAAMLALVATTIPLAVGAGAATTMILPLAVACAGLLAVLSLAGMVWLAPLLVAALALAATRLDSRVTVRRVLWFTAAILVLSVPLLNSSALDVVTNSELHAQSELGNLVEPLNKFQVVGIWPVGDFRRSPGEGAVTALLIGLALFAALAGIVWAFRRRAVALLLYCLGGSVAGVVILQGGSPWVDAKALATISPAVLLAAMVGAFCIYQVGRRVEGGLLAGAIVLGVLWSNVLAYGEVNLAPYDQLSDLERIGERIAGEGPTLMTDNEPYGVRHFLRDADPEGVSELRRRPIPLRGGGEVEEGGIADTDQLQLAGLLVYRTLVLRHTPEQSRPPSPYQLVDNGPFYEVWQLASTPPSGLRHLSLGTGLQPTADAPCDKVRELARAAGQDGQIAFAGRPPNVVFSMSMFEHPAAWTDPSSDLLLPDSAGTASLRIQLPSAGRWHVWLGGSLRGRVDLLVDGQEIGSARNRINYGYYIDLGQLDLTSDSHQVELHFHGSDLHPGSAGPAMPVGPLVFSSAGSADETVTYLPASRAGELCGRRLDWVEALPG